MKHLVPVIVILLLVSASIVGVGNELGSLINSIQNNPPYKPSSPNPPDNSTNVPVDSCVSCTGGDPDGDSVMYDIYFGKINPPPKVLGNSTGNIYCPATLNFHTAYYWKVVATDEHGASTEGPLWSFTTVGEGGNTLYVGGNGPGNYSKIQNAIDNASDGDTVFVYNNVYYETNIVINKSISLIGEDRNTTIIDGYDIKHDILTLTENDTFVKGFTIRNAGHSRDGIVILSNNNVVIECRFLNNFLRSVYLEDGHDNAVSNCDFYDNMWGLELQGWDFYVLNNEISNCTFGPGNDIDISYVKNAVITNCTFNKSRIVFRVGIDGTMVKNCVFYNSSDGIGTSSYGYNMSIENCLFLNCNRDGIYFGDGQYNLTVRNCTFDNCGLNGIGFGYVVGCNISNCSFINSTYNGLYFLGSAIQCNIFNCKFINNEDGIEFFYGGRQVKVNRCHFEKNDHGIKIGFRNLFNRFNENNFIDNNEHIGFEGMNIKIDFYKNNYWDDWRGWGPYHIKGFLNWDWHPAKEPYDI